MLVFINFVSCSEINCKLFAEAHQAEASVNGTLYMKVVLAFDSFKGCMTAQEACHSRDLATGGGRGMPIERWWRGISGLRGEDAMREACISESA